tara:strand:- start:19 stop:684 length:666 start_codon:yes stop_codon:yes gene_type:complete
MPYRSVDEHEVINGLFSSTTANTTHLTAGDGDAGVFVRVTAGDLNKNPLEYELNASVLGKVNYPDVGRNYIPVVPNKFDTATSGTRCIGVTLAQTALEDENGVTFYNDPRKAEANGIVPSGGAVPICSRGIVTLCETAFEEDTIGSVGQDLLISATAGKCSGAAFGQAAHLAAGSGNYAQTLGTILATGSRVVQADGPDRFAGAAGGTGDYAICFIDCISH